MLDDAAVAAALPAPRRCVALVTEALTALASGEACAPPKSVVPGEGSVVANAMPASWPARGLLGAKWVAIAPDNHPPLPTIAGSMIVSDARSGATRAVLAAESLTALRTAAVTGACLPLAEPGPVAFLGAGVQARSHLRVFEALGVEEVRVWARRPDALAALRAWAADAVPRLRVATTDSRDEAVRGARVVVTALAIGLRGTQLPLDLLDERALVLPVDYASCLGADVARAATYASDDPAQFAAVAATGKLDDLPVPALATGDLLARPRPDGRVVVVNLGTGIADLVLADAVLAQVGGC